MLSTPQLQADERLAQAWAVLESVPDPEIPVVSIRELGILRGLARDEDGLLHVTITPTYSGCPAMAQIAEDIGAALDQAGLAPYRIETVLAPPWSTDWISESARAKLHAYGIAPPAGHCASTPAAEQPVRFAAPMGVAPACPRCGSAQTERLAQFGSTACKALYRCLACREPFDYFKPY
ncbi:1,2-phenylacetyl-CoA epoxidase subunit PaaD [Trinickia caryophylli]|uniref:Ring-1,2-phenylacetyl-CoA epoxidase subunit PaaD n=1 Tax=Trinickia caryophylli TaxID=28094 RepID=A0A1X7FKV9_TRICW|nr:1,2-phenylacetyl-CoA epoxidase subunit PaaD [Trinickia caryophylli]PMS13129.1 phenylacetate-CoA oxygenase subunit PaaJ [Trinickia caryophylli]TRX19350.1 phenylacetate-CoA oxygenase subunit PaaJ [Trinickia caryophylli]WQE13347.1 1,2-phenylacetyl-CoA epoxidase subunit PaaD [Trinickia caryophylli]SMF54085.1 ring-1,2-phenylacetyl-CoA epoxidase subunit PaaD [Trinickia caryophylli]GLU34138.1 phenylacetic acid degradation protein PaaD [Trinickia caryophylli]